MPDKQELRRQELVGLLGDLPDRHRPISAQVLSISQQKTYTLEKLLLDLNGLEPVPAYFIRPHTDKPTPCVLYNHAHGGDYKLGKDELIRGRSALQEPAYAEALAARGMASLCIDTWLFGERSGRTESAVFKQMLWQGQVLWGMMIYDSLRAVDYLCTRPDIDANRIGTLGMSMGSTMAWWVAALDVRIKVCVDLCCLTDYEALIESHGLDGHGIYYYVPSLLKHFTSAQINTLIAPRPHLSLDGDQDPLTPTAGLDRIDRELKLVYEKLGHPQAWELKRFNTGHNETPAMRARGPQLFDQVALRFEEGIFPIKELKMIDSSSALATTVGLAASIISVLLGCIYLAAILTSFIKAGLAFPPSEPVQFVGAIVSIAIGIDLVVLMAAIKWHVPEERQILAEIALIFSALLCVSTSINRFVQLSVLPLYKNPENPEMLSLIHPYGSKSIMFAIESLGWGLFCGLAVLFGGLAIVGSGMDAWISWLFIIAGGLSLLYALGVSRRQPILSLLGFPAWSILLPAASVLLAIRFWSMF